MNISTKVIWDMETMEVIERHAYDYIGPVAHCKASSQETGIETSTQNFYNTLQADYSQQFAGQNAILSQLSEAYSPILAAGINQQGFSPSELASFQTQATNQTAAEYQKAAAATGERMAAQGGGNTYLPKGADSQVQAGIAAQAAGQESSEQLQINEANYAQGRQNYLNAAQGMAGVAQAENPSAYGALAGQMGSNAFGEANTISGENNWLGHLGGAVAGILAGDVKAAESAGAAG